MLGNGSGPFQGPAVTEVRPFHPVDIEFERVPRVAYSSNGNPYVRWDTTGMPQLGQYKSVLDCVFFLYKSREDAEAGVDSGGTGFFVGLQTRTRPELYHVYAVTNWHVAVHDGFSVIRVNTKDGKTEIIEFGPENWLFQRGGYDIAIVPCPMHQYYKAVCIDASFFITPEEEEKLDIGAGDDVFMVGRFVDYHGAQTNQPSMRFGNISISSANILQATGCRLPSIVLDMHSRTGFSGSPVFIYRTSGSVFPPPSPQGLVYVGGHVMKLLGIHWGQFPELWELKNLGKLPAAESQFHADRAHIKGLSGMTMVCPSSVLWKMLHMPRMLELREATEKLLERQYMNQPQAPMLESSSPTTDENPRHKEDFTSLLDAATRGNKPTDQT